MKGNLLSVSGLRMSFGGVKAVNDVDLKVDYGELLCIIGPNGAGKTTLLNLLTGTLRALSGTIQFAGRSMVGRPLHEHARMGIVRKFQVPNTFGKMTVRENLEIAQLGAGMGRFGGGNIDEVLEIIDLKSEADKTTADKLAHGQKQWLEIGMALMCRPKLLLLDEPAAGMTSDETKKLAEILLGIDQLSIVVIEHDMKFVRALNSRTVVMHHGQIICDSEFRNVEQDPLVRDVYLGRK
jgi:ABC-type uncharacterized transport system ATPase subunit